MKINSERLWYYVFNALKNKKAIVKVYFDGRYVTEIFWDGEDFEWKSGTFTSGAFFNPLYDFEIIEEDKKIEKLKIESDDGDVGINGIYLTSNHSEIFANKINELIDAVNELKDSDN